MEVDPAWPRAPHEQRLVQDLEVANRCELVRILLQLAAVNGSSVRDKWRPASGVRPLSESCEQPWHECSRYQAGAGKGHCHPIPQGHCHPIPREIPPSPLPAHWKPRPQLISAKRKHE